MASARFLVVCLALLATAAAQSASAGQRSKDAPVPVRNAPDQPWTERVIPAPIVGHVAAYVPKAPVQTVVLFLSGDGGWNLGVVDWARRIMPKAIVLGVDFVALKNARRDSRACWLPAGDLEMISHAAQKELRLPDYHPPIVIGYSSGATLVYEVLATAPPTTFAGGLSLGFCPDLPARQPVCPSENFKPTFDAKKNTAWLPKVNELKRDWYVINGELDQVCLPAATRKFLDGIKGAHFIEVPHTGHGFGKATYWTKTFDDTVQALINQASPAAPAPPNSGVAATVFARLKALDLPLEYRWAARPRARMIFLSGDGGWASLDDEVASYLAGHGVTVVGVNSLRYFWSEKTPEETGADLRRIADALGETPLPLFVGGYSFGAEVAPFALHTWSEAERRAVAGQVLIGPGETASFEVSPLEWIFRAKETSSRVADALRRLRLPTLCVAGAQEAAQDTACDDLGPAAESVTLPGSHHFNGKYEDVARLLLAFIDRHLGSPPAPILQKSTDRDIRPQSGPTRPRARAATPVRRDTRYRRTPTAG